MKKVEGERDQFSKANEFLDSEKGEAIDNLTLEKTTKETALKEKAEAAMDTLKQEFILEKNSLEKSKAEVEASLATT